MNTISYNSLLKVSTITMEAHSAPKICSPFFRKNINNAIEQFDYLRGIPFADSNHGDHDLAINLLIGVKDVTKFFNGCAIKF